MQPVPPCQRPVQVVLVGDDVVVRQQNLLPALHHEGFNVRRVLSAPVLYRLMRTQHFDIVLIDIDLPDKDGFATARHLRSTSAIGIVMLSDRDGPEHHLQALKSGVDVYLKKPVDVDLLAATMHNLSRRLIPSPGHAATVIATQSSDWRLDAGGWRLISPRGSVVSLTAAEHSLARTLANRNNQPVSKETLIRAVAHDIYDFDPHRLDMTIHRLRRKVQTTTGEMLPLHTVRGRGYILSCQSSS